MIVAQTFINFETILNVHPNPQINRMAIANSQEILSLKFAFI
jgi:hypothetical protein